MCVWVCVRQREKEREAWAGRGGGGAKRGAHVEVTSHET